MEHEHQNPFAGIKWHEEACTSRSEKSIAVCVTILFLSLFTTSDAWLSRGAYGNAHGERQEANGRFSNSGVIYVAGCHFQWNNPFLTWGTSHRLRSWDVLHKCILSHIFSSFSAHRAEVRTTNGNLRILNRRLGFLWRPSPGVFSFRRS